MPNYDDYPQENFPSKEQLVNTALRLMEIEGLEKDRSSNIRAFEGKRFDPHLEQAFLLWKRADHYSTKVSQKQSMQFTYVEKELGRPPVFPESVSEITAEAYYELIQVRKSKKVRRRALVSYFFFQQFYNLVKKEWLDFQGGQLLVEPLASATEMIHQAHEFSKEHAIPMKLRPLVKMYCYHQHRFKEIKRLEPAHWFTLENLESAEARYERFMESPMTLINYDSNYSLSIYYWVKLDAKLSKSLAINKK